MLILFVALIVGPVVVSKLKISLPDIPMQLLQPTGLNNNDTLASPTGRQLLDGGKATASGASADTTSGSSDLRKMRF